MSGKHPKPLPVEELPCCSYPEAEADVRIVTPPRRAPVRHRGEKAIISINGHDVEKLPPGRAA
jgi:hypothetical protein